MNEAMRDAGLAAARQVKTGDRSKVRQFLANLKPAPTPPARRAGAAADTAGGVDVDVDVDVFSGESSESASTDATDAVDRELHGLGASANPREKGGNEGGRGDAVPLPLPLPCLDGGGGGGGGDGVLSVVKPARGCASGSVFLCRGEGEAMEAFEKILGTPKYGTPGEFNDQVLA